MRHSGSAVIVLLSMILLALVALVVIVATSGDSIPRSSDENVPFVPEGKEVKRGELKTAPAPPPNSIADPNRIRETLQEGKTYQIHIKAGLQARAEDKDWGIRAVTNLAYAGEMLLSRKIESNDGRRIVELRHFEASRNVKLLYDVEDVEVQLGPAGYLALGALDAYQPGAGTGILAVKPVAEAILGRGAQAVADSRKSKAFGAVDSLSGKKVRIVYVDGVGVESIQPIGCTLTADERDFVFATAALSDCYIFPDLNIKPGGTWKVDGGQLIGFLDPSLRGIPQGSITVVREADHIDEHGRTLASLRIDSGLVRIDRSDAARHRVGTFTPQGTLRYSFADGYVERGELLGDFTIEDVSKDHLLFEASFQTQPKMEIVYSCRLLD